MHSQQIESKLNTLMKVNIWLEYQCRNSNKCTKVHKSNSDDLNLANKQLKS